MQSLTREACIGYQKYSKENFEINITEKLLK
jgi:hypothetical protein